MATKPKIAIVGAGNLASALAMALKRAGYVIDPIVSRRGATSIRRANALAREVDARVQADLRGSSSRVIWFCVPDSQISAVSSSLSESESYLQGRIAFHSSGALSSNELRSFRKKGAAVASVHPLMTFVRLSQSSFAGVPFAVEGEAAAVRMARRIVMDLGGFPHPIQKRHKAAYHAWGAFASPLLTSLLATAEKVAGLAGVDRKSARQRMMPILLQTLANYASFGPEGAFSGPIVRGDVETVGKHLKMLTKESAARHAYVALARAALQYLPSRRKKELKQLLSDRSE